MNRDTLRRMGFGREMDRVEQGLCPFCSRLILKPKAFRDAASEQEWVRSGLCQDCQDEIFTVMPYIVRAEIYKRIKKGKEG